MGNCPKLKDDQVAVEGEIIANLFLDPNLFAKFPSPLNSIIIIDLLNCPPFSRSKLSSLMNSISEDGRESERGNE
jgi:hypothetical protein